jgi:hypothetical protein
MERLVAEEIGRDLLDIRGLKSWFFALGGFIQLKALSTWKGLWGSDSSDIAKF